MCSFDRFVFLLTFKQTAPIGQDHVVVGTLGLRDEMVTVIGDSCQIGVLVMIAALGPLVLLDVIAFTAVCRQTVIGLVVRIVVLHDDGAAEILKLISGQDRTAVLRSIGAIELPVAFDEHPFFEPCRRGNSR